MAKNNEASKAKQVRQLLAVVGAGVFLAILVTVFMLVSYGSSGTYLAKNVLLSPTSAKGLNFNETSTTSGKSTRLTFDLIEFSYYDNDQKMMKAIDTDMKKYASFYELVGNEVSLADISDEIQDLFMMSKLPTLIIKVRLDGSVGESRQTAFSQIDFAKDVYRITLRGQDPLNRFAYFKHTGISKQVTELFTTP